MKGYRKPTGGYIELSDTTPVSSGCVPVALRPSANHVWADTWASNPLDPAVCWRLKTQAEIDAERDAALQRILDSQLGMAVKSVILVGIEKAFWTMAELRAKYGGL